MRILSFSSASLDEAVAVLRQGGVIAHATETCYGLACDLSNSDAVAKLFAIKQRPLMQPVSALFASVDEAKRYVTWNARAEELASKHLPGPLTMILPLRSDASTLLWTTPINEPRNNEITNQRVMTIGIRISSHPHAQALVAAFGSPISTTSANVHGHPNPYSVDDILAQFSALPYQPDLILNSGSLPPVPPSTVMDLTETAETILRKGTATIATPSSEDASGSAV